MSTIYYVTLFLALAFGLCNASIDSGHQLNKAMDNINGAGPVLGVTLEVALPLNALQVHFSCSSGGRFVVSAGKSHQWTVPIGDVDKCDVTWGHSVASFVACDSNDIGHFVHWIVKFDGFFHSWDLYNWEKRASWEH